VSTAEVAAPPVSPIALAAKAQHRRDRILRFALCFGPPFAYLVAFMIVPYVLILTFSFWQVEGYAIVREFTIGNYIRIFENPLYWSTVLRSLEVAFIVTIAANLIGYPLAFFLVFVAGRSRQLLYFLIIIPLFTSFLLRAFIWKTILGRSGVVNTALEYLGLIDEPISLFLYNQFSVCLTLTYVFIPFVTLPIYTALEKIPKELIEASLDLGATPWQTFQRVFLPLSIPGVVAGSIFTFALSFGDFVTPTLLGGPSGIMISNIIIGQFGAAFDWPFGSALAIIVLLVVLITVVVASRFERRSRSLA
jgi:spermidine/putrescine transport system permease protein